MKIPEDSGSPLIQRRYFKPFKELEAMVRTDFLNDVLGIIETCKVNI